MRYPTKCNVKVLKKCQVLHTLERRVGSFIRHTLDSGKVERFVYSIYRLLKYTYYLRTAINTVQIHSTCVLKFIEYQVRTA